MKYSQVFEFESDLIKYAPSSIARLNYLFPQLKFSLQNNLIQVESDVEFPDNLQRDINYTIYREKIYHDTLGIREHILARILTK